MEQQDNTRKIGDIIALMIVGTVIVVVATIVLFPLFAGKELNPYLEILSGYSSVFSAPLGFIMGYYFKGNTKP